MAVSCFLRASSPSFLLRRRAAVRVAVRSRATPALSSIPASFSSPLCFHPVSFSSPLRFIPAGAIHVAFFPVSFSLRRCDPRAIPVSSSSPFRFNPVSLSSRGSDPPFRSHPCLVFIPVSFSPPRHSPASLSRVLNLRENPTSEMFLGKPQNMAERCGVSITHWPQA